MALTMVVDLCIGQSCPSSFEQAKVTPLQRALTAFLDCAGFLDTVDTLYA